MKLDPDTTLGSLLTAIPSSAGVLRRLRITPDGNEHKTLEQICQDHNIAFDQFLRAMDEIDWEEESR
jgi:hypothetical protein